LVTSSKSILHSEPFFYNISVHAASYLFTDSNTALLMVNIVPPINRKIILKRTKVNVLLKFVGVGLQLDSFYCLKLEF